MRHLQRMSVSAFMSGAGIGPSNEDQGSIDASDESRDHMVASGQDQRHQRPKHDTVAGRFVIADCMTSGVRPSPKRVPLATVETVLGPGLPKNYGRPG